MSNKKINGKSFLNYSNKNYNNINNVNNSIYLFHDISSLYSNNINNNIQKQIRKTPSIKKKSNDNSIKPVKNKSINKISLIPSKSSYSTKNIITKNNYSNNTINNNYYYIKELSKFPIYLKIKKLWISLNVSNNFQILFNKIAFQLNSNFRENYLNFEYKKLSKIDDLINLINNNINTRENLILNLKKINDIENNINNITNNLIELRNISIEITNQFLNLRKEISYDLFIGKFYLNYINNNFNINYLNQMKNDTDFLYNSILFKYYNFALEFDPFLINLNNDDNNNKIKIPINENQIEIIQDFQNIFIDEIISNEMININNNNNNNLLFSYSSNSNSNINCVLNTSNSTTLKKSNSNFSLKTLKNNNSNKKLNNNNENNKKNNNNNINKKNDIKTIKSINLINNNNNNNNSIVKKRKQNFLMNIMNSNSFARNYQTRPKSKSKYIYEENNINNNNNNNEKKLIKNKITRQKENNFYTYENNNNLNNNNNKIIKKKIETISRNKEKENVKKNNTNYKIHKNDILMIDEIINRSIVQNNQNFLNNLNNNKKNNINNINNNNNNLKINHKKTKSNDFHNIKNIIKNNYIEINNINIQNNSVNNNNNNLQNNINNNNNENEEENEESKISIIIDNENVEDEIEDTHNNNNINNNNSYIINLNNKNNNNNINIKNYNNYYFQPFIGNLNEIINIYNNFIIKIPEEQKIAFQIKSSIMEYIKGIYPKIILIYDINNNNEYDLNNLEGIFIISYDNLSQFSKNLELKCLCSTSMKNFDNILINFIQFCVDNYEFNEILLDFYYGFKEGKFYLITEIEDIIKNKCKFKWVNMENDGINRKIKYHYLNNNNINNDEEDFYSGMNVLKLKSISIFNFVDVNENNNFSINEINQINDFGLICIISEMINKNGFTIINEYNENMMIFFENFKKKISKFNKVINDFINYFYGSYENFKNFIKNNNINIDFNNFNSYNNNNNIFYSCSKMQIETNFETVIKTSINGYNYNLISNSYIELFSNKDDIYYILHSSNENLTFIIYEFPENNNNNNFSSLVNINEFNDKMNVVELFKNISYKINEKSDKIVKKKIYLPSFKIDNNISALNPSSLNDFCFIGKNKNNYKINFMNLVENLEFCIEKNNNNNEIKSSIINFEENYDENKDIIIKNDFLIAFINSDLLCDFNISTTSAFIVKKSFWIKNE